ncbi:LysM-like peptidoglycan-binding domain-containing protein [Motilimonas pumila]|uniref:LysM domain-containing protein n=1 Tax=Motilimonas pumila TaxID=2303987 RepID=A0A418Y9I5_9GAMM|nr:LysM-like peptidoglycan-binding domain-containing protein [Motilimonas pumila]RJG37551.1 hypothetical protein D1Z90_19710 [Motilimonas pumila]
MKVSFPLLWHKWQQGEQWLLHHIPVPLSHIRMISVILLLTLLIAFTLPFGSKQAGVETVNIEPAPATSPPSQNEAEKDQPQAAATETLKPFSDGQWQAYIVKSGDTLTRILQHMQVSNNDMAKLLAEPKNKAVLSKIHPGQVLSFYQTQAGELLEVRLSQADDSSSDIFSKTVAGDFIHRAH